MNMTNKTLLCAVLAAATWGFSVNAIFIGTAGDECTKLIGATLMSEVRGCGAGVVSGVKKVFGCGCCKRQKPPMVDIVALEVTGEETAEATSEELVEPGRNASKKELKAYDQRVGLKITREVLEHYRDFKRAFHQNELDDIRTEFEKLQRFLPKMVSRKADTATKKTCVAQEMQLKGLCEKIKARALEKKKSVVRRGASDQAVRLTGDEVKQGLDVAIALLNALDQFIATNGPIVESTLDKMPAPVAAFVRMCCGYRKGVVVSVATLLAAGGALGFWHYSGNILSLVDAGAGV